jgi:hypothetical protein
MVISDRTSYGVPLTVLEKLSEEIGEMFVREGNEDWSAIDSGCQKHSIEVLIVEKEDPLWRSLPLLKELRPPLYENPHYAIFTCGTYR